MMKFTRREVMGALSAAGSLSLFNIGCAGFLSAVRGRPVGDNTGLDFSIPLVKTLMLSNMLVFAGKGAYDVANDKTSSAVANVRATMKYRKGWEVRG